VKIVIATDAMSSDGACVRAAIERPWPAGSSFCLLNVFNPYPFTAVPVIQVKLKEKVLQDLETAAKPLRKAGWDTTTEIYPGSARRDISKFAKKCGADLVMVGCNDLNDLGRLLLGQHGTVGCAARPVLRGGNTATSAHRRFCSPRWDEDSCCDRWIRILTNSSSFCSKSSLA
jgi:nucleotide-binding universal stress UspA family protein